MSARRSLVLAAILSLAAPAAACAVDPAFHAYADNGDTVVFSTAKRLVPADGDTLADVYVRSAAGTRLASAKTDSSVVSFSGATPDAKTIVFSTPAKLVETDTDTAYDLYATTAGAPAQLVSAGGNGSFMPAFKAITADGSRIVFSTEDPLTAADTDTKADVYLFHDGVVELATPGNAENPASFYGLSPDGHQVIFSSTEQLTPSDTDASQDVFVTLDGVVADRLSKGPTGGNGATNAFCAGISADFTKVYIWTQEQLTSVDTDAQMDIYLRSGVTTTLVTTSPNAAGAAKPVALGGVGTDGTLVYQTDESLVAGDTDTKTDVYRREGTSNRLLSGGSGALPAKYEGMSPDAATVVFSTDEQLLAGDTDTVSDLYSYRAPTGLQSVSDGPADSTNVPAFNGVSTGGDVYFTTADALHSTDTDTTSDVYIRIVSPPVTAPTSPGDDPAPVFGGGLGAQMLWITTTAALDPRDIDGKADLYQSRSNGTTPLISIEQVPPKTAITAFTPNLEEGQAGTLVFTANEQVTGFECSIDDAAFDTCVSPQTVAPLAVGVHKLSVRSTDVAGNLDANGDTISFDVYPKGAAPGPGPGPAGDQTAPVLTKTSAKPRRFSRRRHTTLRWTLSEAARLTFTISRRIKAAGKVAWVASGAFAIDAKAGRAKRRFVPKAGSGRLRKGTYRVRLRAGDASGNLSQTRTIRLQITR